MAGRRRKWLVVATFVAVVAALAWGLWERGESMEVQLVFVGYTNYTATFTSPAPASVVFTGNVFKAIVMATNSGNESVELHPFLKFGNMSEYKMTIPWHANLDLMKKLPRILNPGEAALTEVEAQKLGLPWSIELLARRRRLGDRLYVNAMAKAGATMQGMIRKCFPPPPEVRVTLGPYTNPPPGTLSRGRLPSHGPSVP